MTEFQVGSAQRLSEGAGSPARLAVWKDTAELILKQPWTGVGWGEFNRAWTLAQLPRRSFVAFDNAHNLALHLIVEMGIPLGLSALIFLGWAALRALSSALRATETHALALRCALGLLTVIGTHSLLEYPLWYLYFLLPAAWLLGLCTASDSNADVGHQPGRAAGYRNNTLVLAGAWLVTCSLVAWADYQRVTPLYEPDALPMPQDIVNAQRARLFGPWADRVYADVMPDSPRRLLAIEQSSHVLVDARLLMVWTEALVVAGDIDKARYLAQRLRDLGDPAAAHWLAQCKPLPSPNVQPVWCSEPDRGVGAEDFR